MNYDKETQDNQVRNAIRAEAVPRWHNRFHMELPFGFTGSVKGFVYYKNEYNIFFQWNPFSTKDENKGWVLTKTRDFVTYSTPQLVLWPDADMDKDGCGSGCAYVADGALRVFYTGRRHEKDGRENRQIQGTFDVATGRIVKDGVVIADVPEGYTDHFQGPYRFEKNGRSYLLLGAQHEPKDDARGCALLYREEGGSWKFSGELSTQLGFFGRVWECPILLRFGDNDVLIFSPRGVRDLRFAYQNLFQSGYIAGHVMLTEKAMLHGTFSELDRGFDFFAPHVTQHEGRHILIGWMSMPHRDNDYPTHADGWMHTLTLPRELTFRRNRLYYAPIKELEALRIKESHRGIEAHHARRADFPLYEATEGILRLTFGDPEEDEVIISFLYGEESVTLTYSCSESVMTINREGMKLGGKGTRQFRLATDENLHLQFFQDKTALEIFFHHGEEVASILVFPAEPVTPTLRVVCKPTFKSLVGSMWALDKLQYRG